MEDFLEFLDEQKVKIVGFFCVVGIVLLVVLLPLSLKKLDFDEVGLQYNKLTNQVNDGDILQAGLHNVGPAGTILAYQTTQRSATFIGLETLTSDGLLVTLDVTTTHTIVASLDALLNVQDQYGGQEAYDAYLRDRSEWVVRNVATQYTAAQFFSQRQAFQAALFTGMVNLFNETNVYSVLNLVQVVNVDLPNSVEEVLNTVTTSQQDIQNAEAERSLLVRQAEIRVTLANSNATLRLLEADRDVSSIVLQRAQDVEVLRARYVERNSIFANASAALGTTGDEFVGAYVIPFVLGGGQQRSFVKI